MGVLPTYVGEMAAERNCARSTRPAAVPSVMGSIGGSPCTVHACSPRSSPPALVATRAAAADRVFHLPAASAQEMAFDRVTPLAALLAPYDGKPLVELEARCVRQYEAAAARAQRSAATLGPMAGALAAGGGGAHEAALRASGGRMRERAIARAMTDRGLTRAAAETQVAALSTGDREPRGLASRDDLKRCSELARLLDRG